MNNILNKLLEDQRYNLYDIIEVHIEEEIGIGRAKINRLGVDTNMKYDANLEMWIIE